MSEIDLCKCGTCDLTQEDSQLLDNHVISYLESQQQGEQELTRNFNQTEWIIPVVFHVRVAQDTGVTATNTNAIHISDIQNFINTMNTYTNSNPQDLDPVYNQRKNFVFTSKYDYNSSTNTYTLNNTSGQYSVNSQYREYVDNRFGCLNVKFVLKRINWLGDAGTLNGTGAITAYRNENTDPRDRYLSPNDTIARATVLNVWICRFNGTLLGIANFPNPTNGQSGLGDPFVGAGYDGFACDFRTINSRFTTYAPNNVNKTAIHEMGHWLGLRHIWGDAQPNIGNDFVDDTPPQASSNSSAPFTNPGASLNPINNSSLFTNGNLEMFFNYMDYTQDSDVFMFTKGQVTRMNAFLVPFNNIKVRHFYMEPTITQDNYNFEIGQPILPFTPILSDDHQKSFSISPALPSGLILNTSTGMITGTPLLTNPLNTNNNYTITGLISEISYTANITINLINSSQNNQIFNLSIGTPITQINLIQTNANNKNYEISPALPSGLILNQSTGIISGTPNLFDPNTNINYTVTLFIDGIIAKTNNFTLNLIDIQNNVSKQFTKDTAITPFSIIQSNAQQKNFSITPSLPSGLILNQSTGIISGTPSISSSLITYTVTLTINSQNFSSNFSLMVNQISFENLLTNSQVTNTQTIVNNIKTTNISNNSTISIQNLGLNINTLSEQNKEGARDAIIGLIFENKPNVTTFKTSRSDLALPSNNIPSYLTDVIVIKKDTDINTSTNVTNLITQSTSLFMPLYGIGEKNTIVYKTYTLNFAKINSTQIELKINNLVPIIYNTGININVIDDLFCTFGSADIYIFTPLQKIALINNSSVFVNNMYYENKLTLSASVALGYNINDYNLRWKYSMDENGIFLEINDSFNKKFIIANKQGTYNLELLNKINGEIVSIAKGTLKYKQKV